MIGGRTIIDLHIAFTSSVYFLIWKNKLVREVKILRRIAAILISLCCIQIIGCFQGKNDTTKFEEIDVERINIVEKDGTLKLALFNSSRLKKGLSQRQGEGSVDLNSIIFL